VELLSIIGCLALAHRGGPAPLVAEQFGATQLYAAQGLPNHVFYDQVVEGATVRRHLSMEPA